MADTMQEKEPRPHLGGLESRKSAWREWTPDQEAPPTQEELDKELASGRMTVEQLKAFLVDEKHRFFLFLFILAVAVLLNFAFFETDYKPLHLSYLTLIAFAAVLGLLGGTYNTFLLEQMKEQVDKYRALNQRLESNLHRLEDQTGELRVTADDMHAELEGLKNVKEQMQSFLTDENKDFQAVYRGVVETEETLRQNCKEQQRQLLQQTAQNFEFALDGEEGMSKEEFDKFCERVPNHYKEQYKLDASVIAQTFERLKNSKGVIEIEVMNKFIDELLEAGKD